MSKKLPKLVTTSHYHLWTDALHARALAHQARNKWDRGTYVRWTANTAWTAFETGCEDALGVTGLGNRFKDKVNESVSHLSLPPLNWGAGIWQKILNIYALRKDYVHVAIPQTRLFETEAEADEAISVLRDGTKAIYAHVGKAHPPWIEDDYDRGWDDEGRGMSGHLTVGRHGANESDINVIKIAYVYKGKEHVSEILAPGTDPEPYIEDILSNSNVPISAVRVYRGSTLVDDRAIPMRGT